jgi:hypothetical protein
MKGPHRISWPFYRSLRSFGRAISIKALKSLIEPNDSDPSRQGFYRAFHIGGRVKEEVIVDIVRDLTEIAVEG